MVPVVMRAFPIRRSVTVFRRAGWLLIALVAASLGLASRADAQAALERHTAPGPLTPATPQVAPAAPSTDQDARPLGANLTAVVLLRAEDAIPTNAKQGGIDADRLAASDQKDLRRSLARFLGQPLSRKLISEIQAAVVRHYRRVGRPFVSVTTPPQELTEGVLTLRVVEFHLGKKTPSGASARADKAIEAGIRARPGALIDATDLEQDLDWLNRSPFRQVTATFAPGAALGETDLQLQAHTVRPWQVTTGYANSGTPSSGLDRWVIGAEVGDLVTPGSLVSYQLTTSDDFWFKNNALFGGIANPAYLSHSLVASTPLAPRQDLTLTADYIETNAPVQAFEVNSTTAELTAVYRSALSNFVPLPGDASVGLEARVQRTDTSFGGTEVKQGEVDVGQVVAGWSGSWSNEGSHESLTLMAHISPGGLSPHNQSAAFAASSSGRVTSAFYSYYDLDYAGDFTIRGRWRYMTAVNVQLADRPLIDTEQFAIGGDGGSRTYVYDDQSFDAGAVWRNELWGPPWRLAISKPLPLPTQPYVFLDGAYGQDLRGGPHQFASSAGIGLNWAFASHLSGGLVGGWSLINAASTRAGQFKFLAKVNAAF